MTHLPPPPSSPVLPSGLVLPKGVRILDPTTLEQTPAEPAVGPPCSRCGLPLPEPDEDTMALLRANPAALAMLAHEICPGETPPPPVGRNFEVRVRIVEVTEENPGAFGDYQSDGGHPVPVVTELVTFTVGGRYNTLDEAMRPLALKLGERWTEAEKQAPIADADYTERMLAGGGS